MSANAIAAMSPMSDERYPGLDAWVRRALAARVAQGLPEHIEDPATLDFLAEVFTHPGNRTNPNND